VNESVWVDIAWAIDQGDAESVLSLCAPLDEPTRARLSVETQRVAQQIIESSLAQPRDYRTAERGAQILAATVARLCLGSFSLEPLRPGLLHRADQSLFTAAVLQRPSEWRESWAVHWNRWIYWPALRQMIASGEIITRPPDYTVRMAYSMSSGWRDADDPGVYSKLLKDPSLLENDVFEIFAWASNLTAKETGSKHSMWADWAPALQRLEAEDRIDRQRLLDALLFAIEREPKARTVSPLVTFYGKLRPTIAEVAARERRYLELLDSPVPPTLALGVREITRLAGAGTLNERDLLQHIPSSLVSMQEATAKNVVGLVGVIVSRNPGLANEACPILMSALSHESPTVQTAALQTMKREPATLSTSGREQLSATLMSLDPSARPIAERILGRSSEATKRDESAWLGPVPPAIDLSQAVIPRLRDEHAIVPIQDMEELLELTSRLLEAADDPDELERWFDGLSRLCSEPVSEKRQAALRRRIRTRLNSASNAGGSATRLVAQIADPWLAAEFGPMRRGNGPQAAVTRRFRSLSQRCVTRTAAPLLSAPTHRGGWIDPIVLVDRVANTGVVDDDDLAQALMRLAPDRAAAARDGLSETRDEVSAIIRAALGEDIEIPASNAFPAAWDAIRVLRSPTAPKREPFEGHSIWAEPSPQKSPITLLTEASPRDSSPDAPDTRRWLSLAWPANREPYYEWLIAIKRTPSDSRMDRYEEPIGSVLETMLDPDEPLGPNAIELLARALGSLPADRLYAADVVIEAITTRRLDCDLLGTSIARILTEEGAAPTRWAEALGHVAPTGPLHSHELQQLLETTIGNLDTHDPRMTKMVDLLRVVAQDSDARITNARTREWLQAEKTTSKLGKSARQLLAITGDGADRTPQASRAAREAELAQRQRWAAAPNPN
jgi:hypothetical protein